MPGDTDDAAFLRELGDRLRLTRTRRGMTRRALAQQSGLSERYIAQTEAGRGNVSVMLLRALAHALAVAPTELLADPPPRPLEATLLDRLAPEQRAEARTLLLAHFGARLDDARHHRIALIGLRGAGKSTLGRMLAASRGVAFHELDREIERQAGIELAEIFELHGQAGYRRLERAALDAVLSEPGGAVIAAGGSIVAEAATFERVLANCRTVWVRASPREHMERVIAQGDRRPMQDSRNAMAELRAILSSREQLYARADLTLDTAGRSAAESLAELVAMLA